MRRNRETLSDEQLLDQCRSGETAAFAQLWERHRLPALTAARSIAPSLDADDLVSNAYLKIFEKVCEGQGPTGAFRPYLYKVIQSIAADSYRTPEHAVSDLEEIAGFNEVGPWNDNAFDLNAAAEAFKTLPTRWQQVLWYLEVEGLAPREVAAMLGMSANSVSALGVRAREGLQSAWVEAHVNMQVADMQCKTTLENLQRFQRGKLTAKLSRDVAAHLDVCDTCQSTSAEFSSLNTQLALSLATGVLGVTAATGLLSQFGTLAGSAAAATASAAAVTTAGTVSQAAPIAAAAATATSVSGGFSGFALAASVAAVALIGGTAIVVPIVQSSAQESSVVSQAPTTETSSQPSTPSEESLSTENSENETSAPEQQQSSPTQQTPQQDAPGTTMTGEPNPTPSPSPMPTPAPAPSPAPSPEPVQPNPNVWNCIDPNTPNASTVLYQPGATLPNGQIATMVTRWPTGSNPSDVIC